MGTNINLYHPRIIAFEDFLQNFRSNINQNLKSSFDIPLPFEVINKIHSIQRFGGRDGSQMLYVDLEAVHRDDYNNVTSTKSEFKLID